jgi:hypothetical protein
MDRHPGQQGSGVFALLSVSSEGDSEDGVWSAWVAGMVAERGGEVDRPARLSAPMACLRIL